MNVTSLDESFSLMCENDISLEDRMRLGLAIATNVAQKRFVRFMTVCRWKHR